MGYIIVGLSRSKKSCPVGSYVIRLYQGWTPYSHIYIRRKEPWFVSDQIVHASEGKVLQMSGTQFDKRHKKILEYGIKIPDKTIWNPYRKEETSLMRFIKDETKEIAGDDYGMMQNIGIALVDFMKLFGKDIKNPWQKGWNCSEFVTVVLQHVFPKAFEGVDPQTVTPKKVKKILDGLVLEGKIDLL